MSDPQQPSVPPSGQPTPVAPPAPPVTHLPATPQYPAAPGYPTVPQAYPTAAPSAQHAPAPAAHPSPSAPAYPAAAQAYPVAAPGLPGGYPPYAPVAPTTRAGNPLGRVAFVIALVTLVVNLLSTLARPYFYTMNTGYEAIIVLDNVIGIISFFVYAIALVLGVIAVRRPGSQALAGIGIGIAGAGMLGLAFTLVTLTFYRFL